MSNHGNYSGGIYFTEGGEIRVRQTLGRERVESKRMNSNLAELKMKLAEKARRKGGNAVIDYKYGQKRTLLSIWDDTMWYAEGVVVVASELPPDQKS